MRSSLTSPGLASCNGVVEKPPGNRTSTDGDLSHSCAALVGVSPRGDVDLAVRQITVGWRSVAGRFADYIWENTESTAWCGHETWCT